MQILRALRSFQFLRSPPTSFAALFGDAAIFALPVLLLGALGLSTTGTAQAAQMGILTSTSVMQTEEAAAVPDLGLGYGNVGAGTLDATVVGGSDADNFVGQGTAPLMVADPSTLSRTSDVATVMTADGIPGQTASNVTVWSEQSGSWQVLLLGARLAVAVLSIAALASLIVASVSARAGLLRASGGAGGSFAIPGTTFWGSTLGISTMVGSAVRFMSRMVGLPRSGPITLRPGAGATDLNRVDYTAVTGERRSRQTPCA